MKVAIIISDGMKQINFTPETESEKQALQMITPDDHIDLAVKSGVFSYLEKIGVDIQTCRGGYLRTFPSEESLMLVITPKKTKTNGN